MTREKLRTQFWFTKQRDSVSPTSPFKFKFRPPFLEHKYYIKILSSEFRIPPICDPRIESRRGQCFAHPFTPALGPTQVPVLFTEVKRPERGVNHPHPYNSEIKERVELYLYSPSRPSWSVLGRNLPLRITSKYTAPNCSELLRMLTKTFSILPMLRE